MFIGTIYIAFRLIGAGIDYLYSLEDNTNTTPIEQENVQVDQIILKLTKVVPNLPIKHVTFLMKTLITSEQLLLSVLKI